MTKIIDFNAFKEPTQSPPGGDHDGCFQAFLRLHELKTTSPAKFYFLCDSLIPAVIADAERAFAEVLGVDGATAAGYVLDAIFVGRLIKLGGCHEYPLPPSR